MPVDHRIARLADHRRFNPMAMLGFGTVSHRGRILALPESFGIWL